MVDGQAAGSAGAYVTVVAGGDTRQSSVTAGMAVLDPGVAALLETPAFSPAFQVERTGFDDRSRAIEFAESLYRGDRYSYEISVFRRSGASQ